MKILVKGTKNKTQQINFYKCSCPICDSVFEFSDSEFKSKIKCISGNSGDRPFIGTVVCPVCSRVLDVYSTDYCRTEIKKI